MSKLLITDGLRVQQTHQPAFACLPNLSNQIARLSKELVHLLIASLLAGLPRGNPNRNSTNSTVQDQRQQSHEWGRGAKGLFGVRLWLSLSPSASPQTLARGGCWSAIRPYKAWTGQDHQDDYRDDQDNERSAHHVYLCHLS